MSFIILKKKEILVKRLRALVLLKGKDIIDQRNSITVLTAIKLQSVILDSDHLLDTQPTQTGKGNAVLHTN